MDYKDYYKILGVDKSASQDEIKKKYRKLAREHHPDVNPNNAQAEAKFKEISEAYEVLSNPESRKQYDALGSNWKQYQQQGQARSQHGGAGGFDFNDWARAQQGGHTSGGGFGGDEGDFSDFFSAFFGGQGHAGQSRRHRGQDAKAHVQISLEDAYQGGATTFSVGGQTLRITLKPGLEDGQTIKLKGKGGPGHNGAEPGDLYITFEVQPHPQFVRKGNDLYLDLQVPLYTMLLGGEVQVPTLAGQVKIKVSPETVNGHVIRLKGKGMPVYGHPDSYGNLYVKLLAQLPTNLSTDEKELLQKLANQREKQNG